MVPLPRRLLLILQRTAQRGFVQVSAVPGRRISEQITWTGYKEVCCAGRSAGTCCGNMTLRHCHFAGTSTADDAICRRKSAVNGPGRILRNI